MREFSTVNQLLAMIDSYLIFDISLILLSVNLGIFRNHKHLFLALGFLLGLVGILHALAEVYNLVYSLYFSEVWEHYLFLNRLKNPWTHINNMLYSLTIYVPIFNLSQRIRSNHRFQFGILVLFIAELAYTYSGIGQVVIPAGWPVYPPIPRELQYLLALGLCTVLTFILVRFRLLPEFRGKNTSKQMEKDL